ncbi:DUF406 family protein [Shewanella sp. SR44-3]|nr:DUF406 family protein [Shewanella sp. SR44-3]
MADTVANEPATASSAEGQNQVNDSCNTCGSFVDIGTVIEANDGELEIRLQGENAEVDAACLKEKALQRFKSVSASMKSIDDGVILALNFEYTVEKMIFQLEENL